MRIRTQLILSLVSFGVAVFIISSSVIQTHQHAGQLSQQEDLLRRIELEASELFYLTDDQLLSDSNRQELWQMKFASLSDHLSELNVNQPGQKELLNRLKANQTRLALGFNELIPKNESMPRSSLSSVSASEPFRSAPDPSDWYVYASHNSASHNSASHKSAWRNYAMNKSTLYDPLLSDPVSSGSLLPDFALTDTPLIYGLDQIAARTEGMAFEASLLGAMLRKQREHSKNQNFSTISILIGLITALLLINYLFFYRGMMRSIADIQTGTRIIGSGNFDVSLDVRTRDEFGELSRAFNIMAMELKGVTASKADLEREVADRKRAEEKLRETRDYLESLIDYANAPIVVWDPAYRITRFNHAFERLTGMRASDVLGMRLDGLFPEESRLASLDHIERALSGEHWETVEMPIMNIDGSVRIVLWNSANIYDKDGSKVVATIAQGQDITERKIAEQDLMRARDELEERVRERTADLSRASEELASRAHILAKKSDEIMRSNEELEQFAYIASHDLQEPLRMISSYMQLLSRRYKGRLDKDADEFIAFAVDGTRRMQQLIDGLLAYSRIGTRGRPPAPISLERALVEAMDNLKVAASESGAVVTHDDLPYVYADGMQMVQLFQNLIGNAIKFRSKETPRVHVAARYDRDEWIISVEDNGIGIDPEFFGRIFTIFQRLHRRDEYPGTGIGLTVSRKIVERHGGRIWLKSEPGKGTTFFFTIPGEKDNGEDA